MSRPPEQAASRTIWYLLPAVTMSLGWGLRGYIGGGEFGAMIPGALIGLLLAILLRRGDSDSALIAALSAVGFGLGGQMTYGQTVGLAIDPVTRWWGLLGLALKGGIWGLAAGGVLATALVRRRFSVARIGVAFVLLVALCVVGWKLVNEPKVVYFSNRLDLPREEMWAGLLLGALGLLVCLQSGIAWRFAGWTALGGWFGFGIGGWIQAMGRSYFPSPWIEYWKAMELFFGFCLGLALAHAAWRNRSELSNEPAAVFSSTFRFETVVAVMAIVLAWKFLPVRQLLQIRVGYTLLGALAAGAAIASRALALQIAITVTFAAFTYDLLTHPTSVADGLPRAAAIAAIVLVGAFVERQPAAESAFYLLLWTSVACSYGKTMRQGIRWDAHAITEILFTVFAVAATMWLRKVSSPGFMPDRANAAMPGGTVPAAPDPSRSPL